jgi:prophage DNA circulation protein
MNKQRWKDKLRPASFRGVRFQVDNVNVEGGRRGPDHEFPDRDEPYAEDTGRKQRKFDIDGYLVGPDYFAAKNKLIQACEKKGPGDLVHPYYGRKKVICRSFTVEEYAAAGGYVRFRFRFVEAGSLLFPSGNADRAFLVDLAGKVLGQAAADDLASAFKTADQAQFVVDSATDNLLSISGQMDSISAGITSAADPVAEFAFAVRNFKASATDLVLSPVALAKNIADAFSLLADAILPAASYAFHKGFFGFGFIGPLIPLTTASRLQQSQNQSALSQYMSTLGVIGAANAAVGMDHKSYEDAVSVRDAITSEIDNLMLTSASDSSYAALQDLRSQLTQAVPDENKNLAHISQVTPGSTGSSLVLAYELYGSVDQEQDIIDRNGIRHPGFVTGGKPLEVLDNA